MLGQVPGVLVVVTVLLGTCHVVFSFDTPSSNIASISHPDGRLARRQFPGLPSPGGLLDNVLNGLTSGLQRGISGPGGFIGNIINGLFGGGGRTPVAVFQDGSPPSGLLNNLLNGATLSQFGVSPGGGPIGIVDNNPANNPLTAAIQDAINDPFGTNQFDGAGNPISLGPSGTPTFPGGLPAIPGSFPGGGFPGGTGELPIGPGGLPDGPGGLPVGPGGFPGGPGGLPVGPGGFPGGPGGLPVGPGGLPVGPGGLPVGPGGLPVGPGGFPIGPGGLPVGPGGLPIGPGGFPGGGLLGGDPSSLLPALLQNPILLQQLLQPPQQSNALGDVLARLLNNLSGTLGNTLTSLLGTNNQNPQANNPNVNANGQVPNGQQPVVPVVPTGPVTG